MSTLRLVLSLTIVLFVTMVAVDAEASRTVILPESIYGDTIRSGAAPDAAHPSGTLYMIGSSKDEIGIVEWDIARAVVVRRVALGMRSADWSLRTARGTDRFYVAAKGDKASNVLLVFDGALRPVFSRELPPGDIDAIEAAGDVLAVTTNLRDYKIRLTSIDPKTYADRASLVLSPNFVVSYDFAPCGPRGALRVKAGTIYVHTRCLQSQNRTFALRSDGQATTADSAMTAPGVWDENIVHAHGLTMVLTETRTFRTRITWR